MPGGIPGVRLFDAYAEVTATTGTGAQTYQFPQQSGVIWRVKYIAANIICTGGEIPHAIWIWWDAGSGNTYPIAGTHVAGNANGYMTAQWSGDLILRPGSRLGAQYLKNAAVQNVTLRLAAQGVVMSQGELLT